VMVSCGDVTQTPMLDSTALGVGLKNEISFKEGQGSAMQFRRIRHDPHQRSSERNQGAHHAA
jgi:hypothetical protein